MQDLILANITMVFHSTLVYCINSYIYSKTPGSQTLYDFILAHTLSVQVLVIWATVLALDLAQIVVANTYLAWSICAIIGKVSHYLSRSL